MLDPEQISALGGDVERLYREAVDCLSILIATQVAEAVERGDDYVTLTRRVTELSRHLLKRFAALEPIVQDKITDDIAKAVLDSQADDLKRMGVLTIELEQAGLQASIGVRTKQTVQGVLEIVARDNLAMRQYAEQAFLSASAKYVTMAQTSGLPYNTLLRQAVSEMCEAGVPVAVSYKQPSGTPLKCQADVAVTRHMRTQVNQAANARTLELMEGYGCGLVEVSSHIGARPSHAEWQGKVYSLNGSHPDYPDFYESTGYEGIAGPYTALGDRLAGVNCRHSFCPYVEGQARSYSPTPDEDLGIDREWLYQATQRQRYLERQIRENKRKVCALESIGEDASTERARIRAYQSQVRDLVNGNEHLARQGYREQVLGYSAKAGESVNPWGFSAT